MLSIRDNISNEVVIKKSKFITFLYRIDDLDSINKYLAELNDKYKDATHICYAYIVDGVKRFSDDGEPGGTAGMPILNVLENRCLNHVLCCVIRYFGGVKLGANGLVRAYSGCCSDIINSSCIINLCFGKLCFIEFDYNNTKVIDNILKSCFIVSKEYDNLVSYTFKINIDLLDSICNELSKFCSFKIIGDCYIEKEL